MAQKAHLLIVDDESNTLASLSRAFRLEGHEATVCDNANKALELAKSQSFDLILSDVVMPGKDGLTLLEELKAQGVPTPVVMMSGQAHIEMAVKATDLPPMRDKVNACATVPANDICASNVTVRPFTRERWAVPSLT